MKNKNKQISLWTKSAFVFFAMAFGFCAAERIGLNKWSGLFEPKSWDQIISECPVIIFVSAIFTSLYAFANRNK